MTNQLNWIASADGTEKAEQNGFKYELRTTPGSHTVAKIGWNADDEDWAGILEVYSCESPAKKWCESHAARIQSLLDKAQKEAVVVMFDKGLSPTSSSLTKQEEKSLGQIAYGNMQPPWHALELYQQTEWEVVGKRVAEALRRYREKE